MRPDDKEIDTIGQQKKNIAFLNKLFKDYRGLCLEFLTKHFVRFLCNNSRLKKESRRVYFKYQYFFISKCMAREEFSSIDKKHLL